MENERGGSLRPSVSNEEGDSIIDALVWSRGAGRRSLPGTLHWRTMWIQNHPSPEGIMIDWSPYPEYLAAALNWWVPFSDLICGVSLFLTKHSKRPGALIAGRY